MSGTPIFGPNRGFKVWAKDEIYTLDNSSPGLFVPNVGDLVIEWVGTVLQAYKVTGVNNTNGSSTLTPGTLSPPSSGVLEEDVLLGSGPATISESYRLYCNNATTPVTLSFDTRLHIYGTDAHHLKVFRGTDISTNGHVISAVFNQNNILISENIPLETVIQPGQNVTGVKSPTVASSIESLVDNEVCTVVVYDVGGTVLSIFKHLVRVTNFVRASDASKKYIVGIDLLTPFMNPSNNHQVDIPINLITQSAHFQGRVRYSDGSTVILPVDGNKFELLGIENYIASVLGQNVPLVLVYHMSSNEYAYGDVSPTPVRFLSENYNLTTIAVQGMYSVKLFAVPRWQTSPTARWVLDYYMYNLDRDEVFEVTPYVQYALASPTFNHALIGTKQTLTVQVNIQQVSPSFNYFQHVQTFSITLTHLGSNTSANGYWEIEYTDGNIFGQNKEAIGGVSVTPGEYTLDVSNGLTAGNHSAWLAEMYTKTEPLYLPGAELGPLTPTHFRLRVGNYSTEIMVQDFHYLIDHITVNPVQGMAARLEFFKRDGLIDYELALGSLTIQRP